jgi:hypothetical protein
MKKQKLLIASQGIGPTVEELTSGLPHESALISGYSNPVFVGAEELFPTVEVSRESGSWTEYGADMHKVVEGLEQPIGAGRKDVSIAVAHGDYKTVKIGLNARIYDEQLNEIEPADRDAFKDRSILRVGSALTLYKEKAICDFASAPANYPVGSKLTLSAGTDRWGDYTNSDPIGDVEALFEALEAFHEVDKSGLRLALAPDVFNKARNHPALRQTLADGRKIPATEESLAQIFGCQAVKVFRGKFATQTDPKDPRTTTFFRLWKNIVIGYRKIETPTIDAPLAGAITRRKGFPLVGESYRDKDRDADVYPTTDKWGMTVRSMNRMYLIDRVIS